MEKGKRQEMSRGTERGRTKNRRPVTSKPSNRVKVRHDERRIQGKDTQTGKLKQW